MTSQKGVIVGLCLLLSIAAGTFAKIDRVIGGKNALIRDFPHLVSFRNLYNKHFCAGSIISNIFILSAAHCFIEVINEHYKVRIFAGSTKLSGPQTHIYYIEKIMMHPEFSWDFSKEQSPHDICVVKTKTAIFFNEYQNRIKLPSRDVFTDNIAIVVGWGQSRGQEAGQNSDVLLKAPMTLYDYETCSDKAPFKVYDDQFCAFYSNEVGTCDGDSGGSVVSNGELYGIISMSYRCAEGIPDIHTKVYTYLPFIKSSIGDLEWTFIMSHDVQIIREKIN